MRASIVFLVCVLGSGSSVFALNPALDVNQYAHTTWKIRDGFTKGVIKSIAQTPDGYLWLGTEFGLIRFDGVRTVEWRPPAGQSLPSTDIWNLLAASDGALWIGTAKGVVRWKEGQLTHFRELAGRVIWRIFEDREHTIWVSGTGVPAGRLCAIRDRTVACDGDDGRFGYGVIGMREDREGNLWLGVMSGIWRWRPGPPVFFALRGEPDIVQAFAEDSDGQLLVTTHRGIRRFVAGRIDAYALDGPNLPFTGYKMLRDREGALWLATKNGVVHSHAGRVDTFGQADGLSADEVFTLFEDREGSVWVSTSGGLDRFRNVVVWTMSAKQGLPNSVAASIRAAPDGSIWVGTLQGVQRWENGRVTSYRAHARPAISNTENQVVPQGFPEGTSRALLADERGRIWIATSPPSFGYLERNRYVPVGDVALRAVRSMVEDAGGTVWVADQAAGLLRIAPNGRLERTPWSALGRSDFATTMTADRTRGGMWLGFWDGDIARFQDGALHDTYTAARGLGAGRVNSLRLDVDGSLWVATAGGLSRVHDGRASTLTTHNGLPCDSVHWVIDDDARAMWLNGTCGLARLERADVDAWVADPRHAINAVVFDSSDGLRLSALPSGSDPFVAKSPNGQIWFIGVDGDGVQVLDPRHLPSNTIAPPVRVEQIVADHKAFAVPSDGSRVDLPPLTRDLQIDYTALSLVEPEKNRFRYKLEGYDRDWQDAGNRRQAFYTNLSPRDYRFRVIASNNSGVWNDTGAVLDFSVAPAYYQTTWFLALSVGVIVSLVWTAHRLRLRIVEQHRLEISALNERMMKAQEQERIRIAGELHDGVMQEMLAVTMMVGTARRRIPSDSDARATLDKIQHKLVQAGTDLRQLSHDLHPPLLQEAGLPKAVQSYCEQFSAASGIPVSCEAYESAGELSRGAALALFRIVQEALGNVAKHARASRITVRLTRSDGMVTLAVSDDGVGLDRSRLASGGGLGLVMMRERASQLNGTFTFESVPGGGTTIRVTIPFR